MGRKKGWLDPQEWDVAILGNIPWSKEMMMRTQLSHETFWRSVKLHVDRATNPTLLPKYDEPPEPPAILAIAAGFILLAMILCFVV